MPSLHINENAVQAKPSGDPPWSPLGEIAALSPVPQLEDST